MKDEVNESTAYLQKIILPQTKITTGRFDQRQAFHHMLVKFFDLSELASLYMDMGIEYESVPGDTREDKVRGLMLECIQQERLKELLKLVKKVNPRHDWPESVE